MHSTIRGTLGRLSFSAPLIVAIVAIALVVGLFADRAAAQDDTETTTTTVEGDAEADGAATPEDLARDEQLREGATAYSQICSSCHQAGGVGLDGRYPPLIDNDNVEEPGYIESVITNGREGEIDVNGQIFDGIMPSFSTLSDADTDAIAAFILNDFVAPIAVGSDPVGSVGSPAGTELPAFANIGKWVAYLLGIGVAGLVLSPRILGVNDRLNFPWLDAWLKTAVIVAGVILLVVVIPDWVLKRRTVAGWSGFYQDLVGVGLWLAGLGTVLGALWYAQRESRV